MSFSGKTLRHNSSLFLSKELQKGTKQIQPSQWRLKRTSSVTQHPAKFSDHKSCESGDVNLSNCHVTPRWSNPTVTSPCLIWYPLNIFKWRYNLFNLSRDLRKSSHWGVIWIYGWKPLMASHNVALFGGHWSRYIVFNLSSDLTKPRDWSIM